MLIRIEDNAAALTPFGSLARVNPLNDSSANSKSWVELLRTAFSAGGKAFRRNSRQLTRAAELRRRMFALLPKADID